MLARSGGPHITRPASSEADAAAPICPDLLGPVLRHPAGVADQVSLAWLATSIPTLGGAALRPR
jgi:hypothetical protein